MYAPFPHPSLKLIYLYVYIGNNTFSPNLMIIIVCTFRNTSNPLQLYEITLFLTDFISL